MDDMFSKISELLDDPVQVEKIKNIAGSLMENKTTEQEKIPSEPVLQEKILSHPPDSGGGLSEMVSSVLGSGGGSDIFKKLSLSGEKMKRNVTLLHAISPYMRPSRAAKISSAVRIIQILDVISKAR